MLWKPTTQGEDTFLYAYEHFGRHLKLDVRSPYSLDFLYSERLFVEFSQLHASLEIFIRALRGAAFSIPQMGNLEPLPFGRHLAKQGYVSSDLVANRRFCEHLKLAARISVDARVPSPALATRIREEMGRCYMCGRQLTQKGDDVDRATVEHLWPLSLGGSSDEGNLIAACKKCNHGRENSVTWAWGPVQATDYKNDLSRNPTMPLRISLAMVRLMDEAAGRNGRGKLLTLKEAAIAAAPLFPAIGISDDRHRTYFELLEHVRETT
jgi:hypothetical protein